MDCGNYNLEYCECSQLYNISHHQSKLSVISVIVTFKMVTVALGLELMECSFHFGLGAFAIIIHLLLLLYIHHNFVVVTGHSPKYSYYNIMFIQLEKV